MNSRQQCQRGVTQAPNRLRILALVLFGATLAGGPALASGDELIALRESIERLQLNFEAAELRHREDLRRLREQISASRIVVEPPENEKRPKGFVSAKNWDFQLGGELEFEFVDIENGVGVNDPDPHFKIDQLYLYPKVSYGENILFSSDIVIGSSGALIEEAWARFYNLPGGSWLEVGLNDLFIANVPRKTEAEILIETAFYRDDDMGLTLGGEPNDWLYWRASLTNGLKLSSKAPGEDNSFRLIHDDRNPSSGNDQLMLGLGVGFKLDIGEMGKLDVLPFIYDGALSRSDLSFLQNLPGYGGSMNSDKKRHGVNLLYGHRNFAFLGQYLAAEDGDLERTGWFIQPSFKFKRTTRDSAIGGFEFVYRYSDLEVDLANVSGVANDTLTWDRQQHIFAVITDVYKSTKVKLEYFKNEEDTGAQNVDNDEILVQFEVKF